MILQFNSLYQKHFKNPLWILSIGFFLGAMLPQAYASDSPTAKIVVKYNNNLFSLETHDAPLKLVLDAIEKNCSLKISGLEHRQNEKVTFQTGNVSLELGIKRFFRYIGESSYAFKFSKEHLSYVAVMQESNVEYLDSKTQEPGLPSIADLPKNQSVEPATSSNIQVTYHSPGAIKLAPEENPQATIEEHEKKRKSQEFTTVTRVQEVVADSQAEEIELLKGDLILEYDGARIYTSRDLVNRVQQKPKEEEVELVVLRNGEPIDFVVNGGFIGVKIRTERILKNTLEGIDLE